MISPTTLSLLVRQYTAEKDLNPEYKQQLLHRVRAFIDHVGQDLPPAAIHYDQINRWLECLQVRAITVWGYRRAIVCILNYAAELGLMPYPETRRIRRPKVQHAPPEAYTVEQVARLIRAAELLTGQFKDGTTRAAYWSAMIRAAYDSGLRRGDLCRLRASVISDTPFALVQHKTGYQHVTRLRSETLQRCRELGGEYPLRWRGSPTYFSPAFAKIAAAAGLPGTFKWLRRTSGSLAGAAHLGHRSAGIFERHYNDLRLSRQEVTLPPEAVSLDTHLI